MRLVPMAASVITQRPSLSRRPSLRWRPRNKLPDWDLHSEMAVYLPRRGSRTAVVESEMPYIVQAGGPEGPISKTVDDPREALAVAIEWETEGRSAVKIIGEGRIYKAEELAQVIIDRGLA